MDVDPQQPRGRGGALSLLNVAIDALDLAKEVSVITPARAAFASVSILLTMIRDSMVNKTDYIELGLACADVCKALERGMSGKKLDDLSQSVCEAIAQLMTNVADIRRMVIKRNERDVVSRLVHAKSDKETIAAWKLDLNRILHVFTTELVMNTHVMVSDLHRNALAGQEGTNCRYISTQVGSAISNTAEYTVLLPHSIPSGESPPPPPRACFGRDELIENIVGLAENLHPIALIGAGGIGKTSIALTVLHHDRIKERFGDNRRFIRCDQFPASRTHFLTRLSKVIGAGVENPEDLAPIRPFLSSREMFLFLDNAESILDPQGTNAREIYAIVEELSQFKTVCLFLTSRISTVPRHCKRPTIPPLSIESACDVFYGIYDNGGQSNIISDLLTRLDFHPLSITLLATTASHNMWDYDRLAREWDTHHTQVLQTDYNESLAATIELSLASPMFRKLGPDAHDLLDVTAFFPQGISESNLDWLFPTISDRRNIFDKLCILSITYRSNGFITMLAPLRDHLRPKDPMTSPLLLTTKDRYFRRLSADVYPGKPGYEEARWITSEDANVEHLLNVFTSVDTNSVEVWAACGNFMEHLYRHKPRLVVLGPKIEGLPDNHPSKPQCLFALSFLFYLVGNFAEYNRLLAHALKFWREQGNDPRVAQTLVFLAESSRLLGFHKEGIQQVEEALETYKRLNDTSGQALSLLFLAWSLQGDKQLSAAEEAASRAIGLLPDEGEQFRVCQCHRVLGDIYQSKGKTEEAIDQFRKALKIASTFDWHGQLVRIHYSLAGLFLDKNRFDAARAHIERTKSHAINNSYLLGCAMHLQAGLWYKQRRFEEAKFEALRAADLFEKIGAARGVDDCRAFLRNIETKKLVTSGESDFDGELLETVTSINSSLSARGTGHRLSSLFRRLFPRASDPAFERVPRSRT